MTATSLVRICDFDDACLTRDAWNTLARSDPQSTVFQTWEWQRAWWDSFGRGRSLMMVVEREGEVAAVAPLFADAGMVFFVGSGGSDYLDFIGDVGDAAVLAAILDGARAQVPDFVGFRFYHVPAASSTGAHLRDVAPRLDLVCFDEGGLPAPAMDLNGDGQWARQAVRKKSLLRHEAYFRRHGTLEVEHHHDGGSILPHLEEFFDQHVARWRGTGSPSLFLDETQRDFYRRVTEHAADSGWLRFTRLQWEGRPIAFHFGFCYRGSYLWYKPSFAAELSRHSPGEVLLRQLLLEAIAEGASVFDFGLGDELFKSRFATRVNPVRTWGLYPKEAVS